MKQVSIQPSLRLPVSWRARWCLCSLGVLLGAGTAVGQPQSEPQQTHDQPRARAPLTFNVWLDERRLGTHRYRFSRMGKDLLVTSEANFEVKLVFVTVFSYEHKALETWRGGCLIKLESNTTTDGHKESIATEFPLYDCAGTYAYWDKTRLQRSLLTNAQTGDTETAHWTELGAVSLPFVGKRKRVRGAPAGEVQGIRITTPSAVFMLYYDNNNQLLMMQTDNEGRTITYVHNALKLK